MNAECSFNMKETKIDIAEEKKKIAEKIKTSLDEIFKQKISTPEEVFQVYSLLTDYKYYSGENYEITFEENTIV